MMVTYVPFYDSVSPDTAFYVRKSSLIKSDAWDKYHAFAGYVRNK